MSEVIYNEVMYFKDKNGNKIPIIMKKYEKVTVIKGSLSNLVKLKKICKIDTLDDGEQEALAVMIEYPDFIFCTCDRLAMRITVLLGKEESLISLQELLELFGIRIKNQLYKHSKDMLKDEVKISNIERINRCKEIEGILNT